MGNYHYLARKDNKTLFELGKGAWACNILIKLKKDVTKIINHDYEDEDFCLDLSNRENIEEYVKEGLGINYDFPEEFDFERVEFLSNKIEKFCDGNHVYWCNDCCNLYFDLIHNFDYKEVDSRYVDKD